MTRSTRRHRLSPGHGLYEIVPSEAAAGGPPPLSGQSPRGGLLRLASSPCCAPLQIAGAGPVEADRAAGSARISRLRALLPATRLRGGGRGLRPETARRPRLGNSPRVQGGSPSARVGNYWRREFLRLPSSPTPSGRQSVGPANLQKSPLFAACAVRRTIAREGEGVGFAPRLSRGLNPPLPLPFQAGLPIEASRRGIMSQPATLVQTELRYAYPTPPASSADYPSALIPCSSASITPLVAGPNRHRTRFGASPEAIRRPGRCASFKCGLARLGSGRQAR